MKFTILALFGLFAAKATEIPTSDDLVEKNRRRPRTIRAEEDELVENEVENSPKTCGIKRHLVRDASNG